MKLQIILQAVAGIGMPEIITLFLSFGFFALIFLAIRSVMLWYWKINDLVNNQREQIAIMQRQNQLIEQQTEFIKELRSHLGK